MIVASRAPNAVHAHTRYMSTGASGTKCWVRYAASSPTATQPQVATPAITAMRLLNSTVAPTPVRRSPYGSPFSCLGRSGVPLKG